MIRHRLLFVLLFGLSLVVEGITSAADAPRPATIGVASLSIMPKKWDKQANALKIEKMVRQAAEAGAMIVITPEGVLEGYVVNEIIDAKDQQSKEQLTRRFQAVAEPMDGPYVKRFRDLADELDIHLIVGFLERDGDRTYNAAVLIGPDGTLVGTYRKTHFHQGYQVNPLGYTPGNDYPIFDLGSLKVGMMICFDRQLPEPARQLALGGADLIACPSYGGLGAWNQRLLQVRAYENHTYVVFTHPEQSLIISRDGEILRQCEKDSFAIYQLEVANLKKTRPSLIHRRPETYDGPSARAQTSEPEQ